MKIERPSFLPNPYCPDIYPEESKRLCQLFIDWFDIHVTPINKMLSEGVEVYGSMKTKNKTWTPENNLGCLQDHKALLINIQPIKKETAEDVLRAYIKHDEMIEKRDGLNEAVKVIYERAKAILGDSDD